MVDTLPQAVGDCADNDERTFCFAYTPAANLELNGDSFLITGAQDSSGNTMLPTLYYFKVDTKGPEIGQLNGTSEGEQLGSSTPPVIRWVVEDLSGATTITCAFDSDPMIDCQEPATSLTLGPGTHTFTLFAQDAQGNSSTFVRNFSVLP